MIKLIFTFLVCTFTLSACNTMEGFGRDVESAGEEIEEGAQNND